MSCSAETILSKEAQLKDSSPLIPCAYKEIRGIIVCSCCQNNLIVVISDEANPGDAGDTLVN